MSLRVSPGCGRPYGIQRVCAVWGFPRSTLYDQRAREENEREKQRPGPKPKVSDDALLESVKEDLASSPFTGEGHRKVYWRLKGRLTAGRDRVLRVMRENQLLSPHRTAQGTPLLHQGTIITDRPNEIWGTDGARVETVEEGWVWGFFALDHFNSECVGWHVAKVGDRFAALQPLAMGILEHFGSVKSGVAAGLAIRADHGTQYTSEDFMVHIPVIPIMDSTGSRSKICFPIRDSIRCRSLIPFDADQSFRGTLVHPCFSNSPFLLPLISLIPDRRVHLSMAFDLPSLAARQRP